MDTPGVLIVPLSSSHIPVIISIADVQFGEGFFTPLSLEEYIAQSTPAGSSLSASMVAVKLGPAGDEIVIGFRIVILPGHWVPEQMYIPCSPSMWPCGKERAFAVAFGVAIAVDPPYAGQGVGSMLVAAVHRSLSNVGCVGIVAHIWASSLSAVALAKRLGAIFIAEHPAAWAALPPRYRCSVCTPKGFSRDQCDGIEVFYLL